MVRLLKHLLLFVPIFYSSQNSVLIPVKIENKWGFINENKKLIIPAQYDKAFPFEEYSIYNKTERKYKIVFLAKVFEGKSMKCILSNNENIPCTNLSSKNEGPKTMVSVAYEDEIIKKRLIKENEDEKIINDFKKNTHEQYDDIRIATYNPLYFIVRKNKKAGITDQNGTLTVPVIFDFVEPKSFTNLQGNEEIYFIGQLYQTINPNLPNAYFSNKGKLFLKNYTPYFPLIPSGLLIKTQNKNGKHLIYNIQEKKHISKKQFDRLGSSYQNGFLLAERNGKEFFIDEKGKEYIYP